ncbi:MAG: hypothetical protein R3C26_16400 [Calditrichia bacterium]
MLALSPNHSAKCPTVFLRINNYFITIRAKPGPAFAEVRMMDISRHPQPIAS